MGAKQALLAAFLTVVTVVQAGELMTPIAGRKVSRAKIVLDDQTEAIRKQVAGINSMLGSMEATNTGRRGADVAGQALHVRNKLEQLSSVVNELSSAQMLLSVSPSIVSNVVKTPLQKGIPDSYEEFKAGLSKFTTFEAPDGTVSFETRAGAAPVTYHLVEEDIALDELDLTLFYDQARELAASGSVNGGGRKFLSTFTSAEPAASARLQAPLRAATELGRVVRWVPGSTLRYCILKWTFAPEEQQFQMVKQYIEAACLSWSKVCNIKFEHVEPLDLVPRGTVFPANAQGGREVLFVVALREFGDAIAMSFFPNDPIYRRLLLVNPQQYFATPMNKVGVFRHELGHILGFRHEHISPSAPVWSSGFCNAEAPAESLEITAYDRASVMHYPCASLLKGAALPENMELKITPLDLVGAQAVYGAPGQPPKGNFSFRDFDPNR